MRKLIRKGSFGINTGEIKPTSTVQQGWLNSPLQNSNQFNVSFNLSDSPFKFKSYDEFRKQQEWDKQVKGWEDNYAQYGLVNSWKDNYKQMQDYYNKTNKIKTNVNSWLNYNTVDPSQIREQSKLKTLDQFNLEKGWEDNYNQMQASYNYNNLDSSNFESQQGLKKITSEDYAKEQAEKAQIQASLEQETRQKRYDRFKNIMGGVGGIFSQTYDAIPTRDKEINNTDGQVAELRGKTAQMMMQSGNPWLMAAGATVGVLDKTGAFGDASEGLGGARDFGNAAAAYLLPGVGWWQKATDKYNVSEALGSSSGYGDSRNFAEKAAKNSGAKLLFGRDKANSMIANARQQDNQIQGILNDAKNDFAVQNNMSEINGLRIQNVTSGGNQMFRAAKHGMKVSPSKEQIEKAKNVINKRGNKVTLDPFVSLEDFIKWVDDKGLNQNDDYDYVKFYGDTTEFNNWRNNSDKNKHFSDKYKKPNHITFSEESIYNDEKTPGGKWYKDSNGKQHFKPSDWQRQQRSYEIYKRYFDENEPESILDWDEPQKFQNGGQMNVIPDGALHARLHHMEDVNPDLKGQITKKGIPVVSEGDGGEIEQQAEIERNELILAKDVTTAIEELWKKYETEHKDEYAIMAGQILAQQIMENTDDRTGLIQEVG